MFPATYQFLRVDRSSRGGGVGAFVIEELQGSMIDTSFIQLPSEVEQAWMEVRLCSGKCLVGIIYKPPLVNYAKLSSVESVLSLLSTNYNNLILLGDFNINVLEHTKDKLYLDTLLQTFSLTQVISEPTRITRDTQTFIDLICIDSELDLELSGTMEMFNLSDHRLVYSLIKDVGLKHINKSVTYRDFRNFDKETFEAVMSRTNFQSFLDVDSPDEFVDSLNQQLISAFDEFAPQRTVKIRRKYRPYITFTIRKIIT